MENYINTFIQKSLIMVSKQTIKDYDFENINDYFDYIDESIINGQRTQAKELIKKLSKEQRIKAYNYFNDSFQGFFSEAKQMIANNL